MNSETNVIVFADNTYLAAVPTSGYSGYVVYDPYLNLNDDRIASFSIWMIPGTFFDDWDNQFKK